MLIFLGTKILVEEKINIKSKALLKINLSIKFELDISVFAYDCFYYFYTFQKGLEILKPLEQWAMSSAQIVVPKWHSLFKRIRILDD